MMVKFLFEAGLPYLALRTAIRSNNAAVIDDMYKYMIVRFRAANKYLYAKLLLYGQSVNKKKAHIHVVASRYFNGWLR